MSKLAVLFSGQGAQKPGMGKKLIAGKQAQGVFEALEAVSSGITRLCLEASAEELAQTIHTQPAVFAMDMAAYSELEALGVKPDAYAGFSLGEYAALAASGTLSLEDAFRLVQKRATWMQECAVAHPGGMVAVLGQEDGVLAQLIQETEKTDLLLPVNYNCPGQTVVAGDEASITAFLANCKAKKVKAIRLRVSGAFHSPYMKEASEKIAETIEKLSFREPQALLYSNATGKPYEQTAFLNQLARQTQEPVRFRQAVEDMLQRDFTTFIEVGVGNTLAGFVRRMAPDAKVFAVDSLEALEELAGAF